MSFTDNKTTLTLSEEQSEERQMRQALGLVPPGTFAAPSGQNTSQKPVSSGRFAGATPSPKHSTGMLDGLRQRLSAAEGALQTERVERALLQRAVTEAQAMIQQLQTKLAHAEIAAAEALEVERQALVKTRAELEGFKAATRRQPADMLPVAKKRGRPALVRTVQAVNDTAEPEPVKWWLPRYRTKTNR